MKERIRIIMQEEGLTPGQFAKEINVQSSSISHIFNDRNKPSTDLIIKILKRFVWVNSEWLLLGKGSKYKTNNDNINSENISQAQNYSVQGSLFDNETFEQSTNPSFKKNTEEKDDEKESVRQISAKTNTEIENISSETNISNIKTIVKEIDKIVVFYSDNTFDLYNSQ